MFTRMLMLGAATALFAAATPPAHAEQTTRLTAPYGHGGSGDQGSFCSYPESIAGTCRQGSSVDMNLGELTAEAFLDSGADGHLASLTIQGQVGAYAYLSETHTIAAATQAVNVRFRLRIDHSAAGRRGGTAAASLQVLARSDGCSSVECGEARSVTLVPGTGVLEFDLQLVPSSLRLELYATIDTTARLSSATVYEREVSVGGPLPQHCQPLPREEWCTPERIEQEVKIIRRHGVAAAEVDATLLSIDITEH